MSLLLDATSRKLDASHRCRFEWFTNAGVYVVSKDPPHSRCPMVGMTIYHAHDEQTTCGVWIGFKNTLHRRSRAQHTMLKQRPITVAERIVCICGDAGYVRSGQWVVKPSTKIG